MLDLSSRPNLLAFLLARAETQSICRIVLDDTSAEPKTGIDAVEHDLTEFVTDFGSISKELQLQDGVYRPGNHSFRLANTQDTGDFLFTLRRNIALNTWINKSYRLLYGMRNPDGTEELLTIYRGIMQGKSEDRINDTVSVNSLDVLKYLSDYKFCSLRTFNTTLNQLGFTDNRAIQPLIKYGIFNLISNKDPFACAEGMGNNASGFSIVSYAPNCIWLFPLENEVKLRKLYFWDYIDNIWREIPGAVYLPPSLCGVSKYQKALFTGLSTPMVSGQLSSTWANYIANKATRTGTYFQTDAELTNDDIKVVASTDTSGVTLKTQNPISIVMDLLNLCGIPTGNIDVSNIPLNTYPAYYAPDISYTFDYSWKKFDEEGVTVNVDFNSQKSVLEIIQAVGKLCSFVVFQSADFSTSARRNLKIAADRFLNPCKDRPVNLLLSTNDNLLSLTMEQNSDEVYSAVTVRNFQPLLSTKDNPDIISVGSTSDLLNGQNVNQFGDDNVYLYDNHVQGQSIAQRLFNAFATPVERYTADIDKLGVILEIGDYVEIYYHRTGETVIGRVNNIGFDCINSISLLMKRFSLLYGPDEANGNYAVWAFCDCAFAGTNQKGGSGSSASTTSGTNIITLNDGTTVSMVVGMKFRMGGTNGGVSGSEYFTIASIIDSTHLTTDVNASATHTNESWSAGKGYFVR